MISRHRQLWASSQYGSQALGASNLSRTGRKIKLISSTGFGTLMTSLPPHCWSKQSHGSAQVQDVMWGWKDGTVDKALAACKQENLSPDLQTPRKKPGVCL